MVVIRDAYCRRVKEGEGGREREKRMSAVDVCVWETKQVWCFYTVRRWRGGEGDVFER